MHIASQGESGFRVVDVWESEDAFRRFGKKLIPILRERAQSRLLMGDRLGAGPEERRRRVA